MADTAALFVPVLPGGAGTGIKTIRATRTVADVADVMGEVREIKQGYEKDNKAQIGLGVLQATAGISGRIISNTDIAKASANLVDDIGSGLKGTTKAKPYSKARPSYRKGQVDEVWENAKQIDGKVYDPNTGEELFWDRTKSRKGQWDMGHTPENKYSEWHRKYMDDEITLDEFKDWYRNLDHYRPESPSANRSHMYE